MRHLVAVSPDAAPLPDAETTLCDWCSTDLTADEAVHGTHCSAMDCMLTCPECAPQARDDARSDRAYDADRHDP